MKALEKVRERRYESASALVMDIQKHSGKRAIGVKVTDRVRAGDTVYKITE